MKNNFAIPANLSDHLLTAQERYAEKNKNATPRLTLSKRGLYKITFAKAQEIQDCYRKHLQSDGGTETIDGVLYLTRPASNGEALYEAGILLA